MLVVRPTGPSNHVQLTAPLSPFWSQESTKGGQGSTPGPHQGAAESRAPRAPLGLGLHRNPVVGVDVKMREKPKGEGARALLVHDVEQANRVPVETWQREMESESELPSPPLAWRGPVDDSHGLRPRDLPWFGGPLPLPFVPACSRTGGRLCTPGTMPAVTPTLLARFSEPSSQHSSHKVPT
ncbi:hypothetical protein CB1_001815064 [Camelus ferus]|nr:hypothetical protein CB1_001815064 [Camelus ferus]